MGTCVQHVHWPTPPPNISELLGIPGQSISCDFPLINICLHSLLAFLPSLPPSSVCLIFLSAPCIPPISVPQTHHALELLPLTLPAWYYPQFPYLILGTKNPEMDRQRQTGAQDTLCATCHPMGTCHPSSGFASTAKALQTPSLCLDHQLQLPELINGPWVYHEFLESWAN